MTGFEYVGTELDVFALAVNWKRYFTDVLSPYVRGRVLEVGAGVGETTRAMLNPRVHRWVCVEPDARLAGRLSQLQFAGGVRPEIIVGDLHAVGAYERFDTILYVDVLEHIRDDAVELGHASALLAPGGYLIVLSPAFPFLYSAFDKAIGHERRYTATTLAAAFPQSLARIRVFYLDSLGATLSCANRLLLRSSMPNRRQVLFWDRWIIASSRRLDRLVGFRVGRSVIAVYQKVGDR